MTDTMQGRCRYFLTYTGVKLPLKLMTELEPAQLENRNTYFRGHFDAQDRLIGLQKLVYGEVEMEHRYAAPCGRWKSSMPMENCTGWRSTRTANRPKTRDFAFDRLVGRQYLTDEWGLIGTLRFAHPPALVID